MTSIKIIDTGDGSHTLYNTTLDETYHSRHGALTESQHVFIKEGLKFFIEQHKVHKVNILEVGFGTGLNALLTCIEAEKLNLEINFYTLEPFPVKPDLLQSLNYKTNLPEESRQLFDDLHHSEWESDVVISSYFTLHKSKLGLEHFSLRNKFDIIFFDAFAPKKQPELWEISSIKFASDALKEDGIFVTYSATGNLKRNLKKLGLTVQLIPGPPGKREMTRAIKQLC